MIVMIIIIRCCGGEYVNVGCTDNLGTNPKVTWVKSTCVVIRILVDLDLYISIRVVVYWVTYVKLFTGGRYFYNNLKHYIPDI